MRIRASGDERLWTVPRRDADGKPGAGTTSVVVPFTPLGEAVVPANVPEWGGVAFGRGVVFVRTEDDDGQPIVLRIRYAHTH